MSIDPQLLPYIDLIDKPAPVAIALAKQITGVTSILVRGTQLNIEKSHKIEGRIRYDGSMAYNSVATYGGTYTKTQGKREDS